MKKILIALIAAFLTVGSAFALDDNLFVEFSGEIKTGLFYENREYEGETYTYARIHNNDGAAGDSEGRVRFGLNMETGDEIFGIRSKFKQTDFSRLNGINDTNVNRLTTEYLYAYGYLFDKQLKISAGLLGESPWGSGGPELFREIEYTINRDPITGVRFEWMPGFLKGLNLGFVLNRDDDTVPGGAIEQFGDIFMESVEGAAYKNDFFEARFAFRFDRDVDSPAAIVTGSKLVYRFEEYFLRTLVEGLSISANGYGFGLAAEGRKSSGREDAAEVENWLYILYAPDFCTAGMNVMYKDNFVHDVQKLEFKPFFYYNFLDMFSAGAMGGFEMGFNNGKTSEDYFYNFWYIEPKIGVEITENFSIAFHYRYTEGSYKKTNSLDQIVHWINLRVDYSF